MTLLTLHSDPGRQTAFRAGLGSEIKHDGYRLIVRRDGEAVRLPLKTSGAGFLENLKSSTAGSLVCLMLEVLALGSAPRPPGGGSWLFALALIPRLPRGRGLRAWPPPRLPPKTPTFHPDKFVIF
jgi:hypothetical protein